MTHLTRHMRQMSTVAFQHQPAATTPGSASRRQALAWGIFQVLK